MSAGTIARKPASLGHEEAAALPVAGVTALVMVDAIAPNEGDVLVVLGATGGVGGYLVQLASRRGARVVGVCRGENADYARSLGAADVVDYTAGDVAEAVRSQYPDGIHSVADLHGDREQVAGLAEQIRSGGRVSSAVGSADADALSARGIGGTNVYGRVTTEALEQLAGMLERGECGARDPDLEARRGRRGPLDRGVRPCPGQAGRHSPLRSARRGLPILGWTLGASCSYVPTVDRLGQEMLMRARTMGVFLTAGFAAGLLAIPAQAAVAASTILVSQSSGGVQGNDMSGRFSPPAISGDGQVTAFDSMAGREAGGEEHSHRARAHQHLLSESIHVGTVCRREAPRSNQESVTRAANLSGE